MCMYVRIITCLCIHTYEYTNVHGFGCFGLFNFITSVGAVYGIITRNFQ